MAECPLTEAVHLIANSTESTILIDVWSYHKINLYKPESTILTKEIDLRHKFYTTTKFIQRLLEILPPTQFTYPFWGMMILRGPVIMILIQIERYQLPTLSLYFNFWPQSLLLIRDIMGKLRLFYFDFSRRKIKLDIQKWKDWQFRTKGITAEQDFP